MMTLPYDQQSLHTTSTSAIIIGVGAYLIFLLKKEKLPLLSSKNDGKQEEPKKSLPPMAQMGFFHALKELNGDSLPSFVMEVARDLHSYIYRLPIGFVMGYANLILIGEPKVAKAIFNDPSTTKPIALYAPFDPMTGGASILTSNGSFWHSRRKGVAPAFATKHVKRMNEVASQKVDEWIETKLAKFIEDGQAFDIGEEMIDVTLSTISEAGFEYKITNEDKKIFKDECALGFDEFVNKSSFNPLRPYLSMFLKDRRRALVAASKLQQFALKIIDEYRKLENPIKDTLIDRIMNNTVYKNDKERAADIIVLFIAGHDTTAFTIAWILLELAKHPEEQKKLRTSLASLAREKWHQSHELRNITKEGMRLHPVAAGGAARVVQKDFVSDSGCLIPRGSLAFFPINLSTCNPNVFKDAEKFIPSRWDKPTDDMNDAYLPFAAGKQNCVGQSLANAEIHSVIPKICAQFELEVESEGTEKFLLTLQPHKAMLKAKRVLTE